MRALPLVVLSLLAVALFAGCGVFGDDNNDTGGEIPTIDPTVAASMTVEFSGLPPEGTVIVVNQRYYLLWQQAKERITPEETTLEALQAEGISEGEPLPATPLTVSDTPPAAPPRWVSVTTRGETANAPSRTVLYIVIGNQARKISVQPLIGISELGIPDGSDPSAIERVQVPEASPAATPTTPP